MIYVNELKYNNIEYHYKIFSKNDIDNVNKQDIYNMFIDINK